MSDFLNVGDYVSSDQKRFRVLKELGEGGQGRVYCVSEGEQLYALKWYNKLASSKKQYEAIQMLIEKGAPSEKFIWPVAVVEGSSPDNFGYVMPLINTKKYSKLALYFSGEVKAKRFETLIDACLQMAEAFYDLHLSGLCYRDISFGNLFINFETGDVLICDNDNVTFDSLTSTDDTWGTNGFMAPEVLKGESPPSSQTDLFSLSVVLFRMLHLQHPLQGQREYEVLITDHETELELYGRNPIFIYDPVDGTNRPVKGKKDIADAYWPYYPEALQKRFIEAFTAGLHDPHARVRESIWIREMSILKAQLHYCYECGAQMFYDYPRLKNCPSCGAAIKTIAPRLKIGDRVLMLNHDTVLYSNQMDTAHILDHSTPYAKIEVHPVHTKVWGLRNLSDSVWRYVNAQGEMKTIEKNGVVPIVHELEVQFGTQTGIIRAMWQKK